MLDSFGTLSSFDTKVQLNDLPLVVKVFGRVDGPDLNLKFVSGGVSHEVSFPFPDAKQLDGELIPEPKLLQIYVGRKWQVEMFSLFRPPSDALTLLQAEVVAEEIDSPGRPHGARQADRVSRSCRRPASRPSTRCGPRSGSATTAPCCGRMFTW